MSCSCSIRLFWVFWERFLSLLLPLHIPIHAAEWIDRLVTALLRFSDPPCPSLVNYLPLAVIDSPCSWYICQAWPLDEASGSHACPSRSVHAQV
ncbi:hypothetical protein BKA80DRAFT_72649 [Phyllosticta citrichinensis]